MTTYKQPSFARGEIDPALHARTDQDGYRTGADTVRNMVGMRSGGLENRAGLSLVYETKQSSRGVSLDTNKVQLFDFVFNADDGNAYVLEFGYQYIRFHKNSAFGYNVSGPVIEPSKLITAITNANPGVVTTSGAHGYVAGDEVRLIDVVGMHALQYRTVLVGTVGGAGTTFQLLNKDGTNINTTSMGTWLAQGDRKVARVYEISTPYGLTAIGDLNVTQLNDVLIITHPSYAPRKLVRTSDYSWTLSTIAFGPTNAAPTAGAYSGTAGAVPLRYKVTAVDAVTLAESYPGISAGLANINAITLSGSNAVRVTFSAVHTLSEGDEVYFAGIVGTTELNGNYYTASIVSTTVIDLLNTNSANYTAWSSGGQVFQTEFRNAAGTVTDPSTANPVTVVWTAVTGAKEYNVYRLLNGVYGFIGTSRSHTFVDTGYGADTADTPPTFNNPFLFANDWPSCSIFYQSRLIFANSTNKPNGWWPSKINKFYDFSFHTPTQDSDSFAREIVGRKAIQIKSMMDLGRLAFFTSDGEFIARGDVAGALTPSNVNLVRMSGNGSTTLPSLLIDSNAVYVQARSSQIRDFAQTATVIDGYRGDERSIWSSHLFRGYTVVDWAYQQVPNSIVWLVRSDGALIGITYIREQSLFCWHRHDTDGTVENVSVIPEGGEDAVYFTVRRTINSTDVRYVEKMEPRTIAATTDEALDNVFLDASYGWDGRLNLSASTWGMKLTTSTVWTAGTTLTLTSEDPAAVAHDYFTADMLGDRILITGTTGVTATCTITARTSASVVSVTADIDIPAAMQSTDIFYFTHAKKTLYGLHALIAENVAVLGDGRVVANPLRSELTTRTVSATGSLTLGSWYSVISVGLPYVWDFKSLRIDTIDPYNSIIGMSKLVNQVNFEVLKSLGGFVGEDLPAGDAVTGLDVAVAVPSDTDVPDLVTSVKNQIIRASWNMGGQIAMRGIDPLPFTLLSIAPQGKIIPGRP